MKLHVFNLLHTAAVTCCTCLAGSTAASVMQIDSTEALVMALSWKSHLLAGLAFLHLACQAARISTGE